MSFHFGGPGHYIIVATGIELNFFFKFRDVSCSSTNPQLLSALLSYSLTIVSSLHCGAHITIVKIRVKSFLSEV